MLKAGASVATLLPRHGSRQLRNEHIAGATSKNAPNSDTTIGSYETSPKGLARKLRRVTTWLLNVMILPHHPVLMRLFPPCPHVRALQESFTKRAGLYSTLGTKTSGTFGTSWMDTA